MKLWKSQTPLTVGRGEIWLGNYRGVKKGRTVSGGGGKKKKKKKRRIGKKIPGERKYKKAEERKYLTLGRKRNSTAVIARVPFATICLDNYFLNSLQLSAPIFLFSGQ